MTGVVSKRVHHLDAGLAHLGWRGLGRFQIGDEARFEPGGFVFVQHALGGGLIEFLDGGPKFGVESGCVGAFGDRVGLFELTLNRRLRRAIAEAAALALTMTFGGAFGIRHNAKG